MSFLRKIKSIFKQQPPKYHIYTAAEIKIIALRTRVILQNSLNNKLPSLISADEKALKLNSYETSEQMHDLLLKTAYHIAEYESLKILVELGRRIEDGSTTISLTNGDISHLSNELKWFQCLLWYRKCCKITNLQQLNTFCLSFFKGVDIIAQLDSNHKIFQSYPVLKYLDNQQVIPLKLLLGMISKHMSFPVEERRMQEVMQINQAMIKSKSQGNLSSILSYSVLQPIDKKRQHRQIQAMQTFKISKHSEEINHIKPVFKPISEPIFPYCEIVQVPNRNVLEPILSEPTSEESQKGKTQNTRYVKEQPMNQLDDENCQASETFFLKKQKEELKDKQEKQEQDIDVLAEMNFANEDSKTGKYYQELARKTINLLIPDQEGEEKDHLEGQQRSSNDGQRNIYKMTEDKIDNGNEESALIDSNIIYTSIIGAGNAIVEPADQKTVQEKPQQEQQPAKKIQEESHQQPRVNGIDDQQQSLQFIRQILQPTSPSKKRPYMMSIYARGEYVNQAK